MLTNLLTGKVQKQHAANYALSRAIILEAKGGREEAPELEYVRDSDSKSKEVGVDGTEETHTPLQRRICRVTVPAALTIERIPSDTVAKVKANEEKPFRSIRDAQRKKIDYNRTSRSEDRLGTRHRKTGRI
jgi:hypothetical protein